MPQSARGRSSSAAGRCGRARGPRLQWPRAFAVLQRAATTRHWNYADYCSCPNWHRYWRSIKGKRLIKTCFQRETMPMSQRSEIWFYISHDLPFYYIHYIISFWECLITFPYFKLILKTIYCWSPLTLSLHSIHPYRVNYSTLSTSPSLYLFLYKNERDGKHPQSASPPLNLGPTRIILHFRQSILCLMDRRMKKLKILAQVSLRGRVEANRSCAKWMLSWLLNKDQRYIR